MTPVLDAAPRAACGPCARLKRAKSTNFAIARKLAGNGHVILGDEHDAALESAPNKQAGFKLRFFLHISLPAGNFSEPLAMVGVFISPQTIGRSFAAPDPNCFDSDCSQFLVSSHHAPTLSAGDEAPELPADLPCVHRWLSSFIGHHREEVHAASCA